MPAYVLSKLSPRDLLQELAGTAKVSAKSIRVLLLERRSEVVPVTVILLNRPAMILHYVGRFPALGAKNFAGAALREAALSEHIGNMDSVHPVNPFGLDARLDGDRDAVYDHDQHSNQFGTNDRGEKPVVSRLSPQ
jgi:hypothetical protein